MYDVEADSVSMVFNLETSRIDSIKEYAIKLAKRQLHYKEFTALSNISFKMKSGDSLAVIGGNGAGKSTLMKCVAGVYKPTVGKIITRGLLVPLLELGAGFDGQLSGRENIFLNGAILGHSKNEMLEMYDEIVEFSGLQEFIEAPIKNYSSGMRTRLGFAIATMVKPDILLLDEIMSVGDMAFRKKCSERIEGLLSGGTTLIFSSHDNVQVVRLCKRAIWLNKGVVEADGDSSHVVDEYKKWSEKYGWA